MENEFRLSYTAANINARLSKIDNLAEKTEVPKKTSDLMNDSNFATENYIQSVISDVRSDLNDYALNSKVDKVKQEAINASNSYTDEQIKSVLVYASNADIDMLF